jgi:NAD-dependent histone deacetylase SIR2
VHLTARSVWSDVRALVSPRVSITNEIFKAEARVARSARPLKVGALRPAIVLYGEPHPLGDDIGCIQTADLAKKPDMLIIMGTSLKVHGLKRLVRDFARVVRQSAPSVSSPKKKTWAGKVVFVNRTPPSTEWADVIDYHVAGDTDKWVTKVLEDWKKMRPADWETQQTLVGADGSAALKVVAKSGASKAKGSCFQLYCISLTRLYKSTVVGVKKPRPNQENICPIAENSVFTSPLHANDISKPNQSSVLPTTPTKRRQAASHYCDVESSPSKKRDIANPPPELLPEERGLLFGNHTNIDHTQEKSLSVEDVKSVKSCRGQARPRSDTIRGSAPGPAALQKAKASHKVWVEIDIPQRCRPSSRCT